MKTTNNFSVKTSSKANHGISYENKKKIRIASPQDDQQKAEQMTIKFITHSKFIIGD